MTEQELSRRARHRLAIIRHAQEVTGNVALTCRSDGISRQRSDQWDRRYQANGLDGLRDRSKRPLVSPRATRTEVVGKISYLRQHHHFGPTKLAMSRKRYHDIQLSSSGVWRILKRLGMNRLPASQRWKRDEKPQPGHRVQIDVTFIQPLPAPSPAPDPDAGRGAGARTPKPKKYYQFTATCDGTRLRVLRSSDRCTQQTAIQFLDDLLERLPFQVEVIQTDNGAEFQSSFHWQVLDKGIAHVYSKPHIPASTARSSAPTASTPRSATACLRVW